jgi:hypothetical protein
MVIIVISWVDLVAVYYSRIGILRELVVWLSELLISMGV